MSLPEVIVPIVTVAGAHARSEGRGGSTAKVRALLSGEASQFISPALEEVAPETKNSSIAPLLGSVGVVLSMA